MIYRPKDDPAMAERPDRCQLSHPRTRQRSALGERRRARLQRWAHSEIAALAAVSPAEVQGGVTHPFLDDQPEA